MLCNLVVWQLCPPLGLGSILSPGLAWQWLPVHREYLGLVVCSPLPILGCAQLVAPSLGLWREAPVCFGPLLWLAAPQHAPSLVPLGT